MSTEKFENYAQANLNNYRSAVDAEALWLAIEPAVQPRKRKGFFWYWLSGGLLLSTALLYFALPITVTQTIPATDTAKATMPVAPKHEDQSTILATSETSTEEDTPKMEATENPVEKNAKNTSELRQLSHTSTSKKPEATSNPNSTKFSPANTSLTKSTQLTANRAEEIKPITNPSIDNIEGKSTKEIAPVIEQEITAAKKTDIPVSAEDFELASTTTTGKNEENLMTEIEEVITEKEEVIEPLKIEEEIKSPPPPRFWSRHSIGFGVRAGIGNSITTLTAAEEFGKTIRVLREDSETKLESLDFGFDILLKSNKNGYYVATGVDYQRSARRMNFDELISSVDSVYDISMIIMNPITMVNDTIFGNVARTTTNTSTKEIFNNIHFINIPISAGYAFQYDNWSFGVEAGALINIATLHKGQIRDSQETFYDMKTDDNNWFSENVGVSFKGAIQIGYSPVENFQIIAGPNFRSPVKVSDMANPVKQEQSTLGFQVAARYWLDY